jgi:membrane protease YdiL (CAAX protease family)
MSETSRKRTFGTLVTKKSASAIVVFVCLLISSFQGSLGYSLPRTPRSISEKGFTVRPRGWTPTKVQNNAHTRQNYNLVSGLKKEPTRKGYYAGLENEHARTSTALFQRNALPEEGDEGPSSLPQQDDLFDGRTTLILVGGQSLLIVAAAIAAAILQTPNWGFGPNIVFDLKSIGGGFLLALPLGGLAAALDLIEDRFPALQDVTKATQRSILALMGGTFKPLFAFFTALALGLAAGFGEEMLFRGILQYELANRFGPVLAVGAASIVFGALHAVTPLYAFLATLASVYFGAIYLAFDNLAVPIWCHTIYDVGALYYAHWTVCQLTQQERNEIAFWEGPGK